MSLRRSLRSRAGRDDQPSMDANTSARPTRVTRAAALVPAVTVHRAPSGLNGDSKRSIHLTVKMPSNKLREVTGGSTRSGASTRRSVNVFTENPIITGPRTSRPRKKLVEVDTSDEDDLEDQEEDEVDDEDAPGEDDDDVDADGDLDMDDAPPQPPMPRRHAKAAAAAAPPAKSAKSVEAKEMELENEEEEDDDDDDDEELSELESDAEGEPDDQDESMLANINGAEDLEEEEDELDSDDDEPGTDLTRMTKRQRGNLGNDFLQLPMEPQIKKHLTAEERAMRRAEMARRRKNLSEKRNEEEKMDTINRLLRKQAPKRRGRIPAGEAGEGGSGEQEGQEVEKADPVMARWVSGREGSRVGVPEEWLGMPAGRAFGALGGNGSGKLVQEV